MRRPRAHLRKDTLRRVSAPKAATPPAGDFARRSQSAGMQVAGADRAEFAFWRLSLPVIEHVPPEAAGPPALDRVVALADCAGEVPAGGNVNECAVGRVRIPTPTGDPTILPPNRAVVPLPRADRRVAPRRSLLQLRRPAPPAVDATGDVQRASVITSGIKRDVAVRRRVRSQGVGNAKCQEREQQRGDREPDQEGFMPPPPDRVSAAAVRRAWWRVVSWRVARFTPATLHQPRL